MDEPVHIVVSLDDNYVIPLYVMLFSILENTQAALDIFVIQQHLHPHSRSLLSSLFDQKKSATISFVAIPTDWEMKFPHNHFEYISEATFYRLALADLLPAHIDRVLYLDCDLIIEEDISTLWKMDLSGKSIGAIAELFPALPMFPQKESLYQNLGLSDSHAYFNAGVLLFDLAKWRRHNWGQACLTFLLDFPEKVLFDDQDALNYVLKDDWQVLPARWNVTNIWFRFESELKQQHIWQPAAEPAIIHFTTHSKPWQPGNRHPYRGRFFEYWRRSPLVRAIQQAAFPDLEKILSPGLAQFFQLSHLEQDIAQWVLKLNELDAHTASSHPQGSDQKALTSSQQQLHDVYASLSWKIGNSIVRFFVFAFGWIPWINKRIP